MSTCPQCRSLLTPQPSSNALRLTPQPSSNVQKRKSKKQEKVQGRTEKKKQRAEKQKLRNFENIVRYQSIGKDPQKLAAAKNIAKAGGVVKGHHSADSNSAMNRATTDGSKAFNRFDQKPREHKDEEDEDKTTDTDTDDTVEVPEFTSEVLALDAARAWNNAVSKGQDGAQAMKDYLDRRADFDVRITVEMVAEVVEDYNGVPPEDPLPDVAQE